MEESSLKLNINSINDQELNKRNIEPFDKDDSEKGEKPKKCSLSKFLAIIALIILVICIILIIIIIVYVRKESTRPPYPEEIIGVIKCEYFIENENSEIEILSKDYQNLNDIDIFIDNKRILFSKKHKFINSGIYKIDYYLDNNETMDFMFKNISSFI